MLCSFQVSNKVVQLYIYMYYSFLHMGYRKILSRDPCDTQGSSILYITLSCLMVSL